MLPKTRLLAVLTAGILALLGSVQVQASPIPVQRQGPAFQDPARDTARPPWCKKKKNKNKPACVKDGKDRNCHPSYQGACLDPNASDYDCAGGSGDGPKYTGTVTVVGPDEYGLDSDGDGIGCE